MNGYKVMTVALGVVVSVLLGIAAYLNRESKDIFGFIAVAASLVLLMGWLSFDLIKEAEKGVSRLEITVLIPNFRGKQWYAQIEIDREGRLIAPSDPLNRLLSPAEVDKRINILRAPHYDERGNTLIMLGEVFQAPPVNLFGT